MFYRCLRHSLPVVDHRATRTHLHDSQSRMCIRKEREPLQINADRQFSCDSNQLLNISKHHNKNRLSQFREKAIL